MCDGRQQNEAGLRATEIGFTIAPSMGDCPPVLLTGVLFIVGVVMCTGCACVMGWRRLNREDKVGDLDSSVPHPPYESLLRLGGFASLVQTDFAPVPPADAWFRAKTDGIDKRLRPFAPQTGAFVDDGVPVTPSRRPYDAGIQKDKPNGRSPRQHRAGNYEAIPLGHHGGRHK